MSDSSYHLEILLILKDILLFISHLDFLLRLTISICPLLIFGWGFCAFVVIDTDMKFWNLKSLKYLYDYFL